MPLSEIPKGLTFASVSIIPFTIIKQSAYILLGVSKDEILTLVGFGGSIKEGQSIEKVASDLFYDQTCHTLYLSSVEIMNNAVVLYSTEFSNAILFIQVNAGETIEDLDFLCSKFRTNFIREYHKDHQSVSLTHLLWINQLNFLYIVRNTTYTDGENDSEGNLIRKNPVSGNIPLEPSLQQIYSLKTGEYPIGVIYNEKANAPPVLFTYPKMDVFLRNLLGDAFDVEVDFFGTVELSSVGSEDIDSGIGESIAKLSSFQSDVSSVPSIYKTPEDDYI